MSEQRLVTLHGGPLDGRARAWEAGQTTFDVLRWHYFWDAPIPPMQYTSGRYRGELDAGDAFWEWVGDDPPKPPRRRWWTRLFGGGK